MVASTPHSSCPESSLRVLLVDDDDRIRLLGSQALGLLGYRVASAEDARTALRLLGGDAFDVLLTDIRLPDHSGIELARQAIELQPRLRVVLASGQAPDALPDALQAASARFLLKPYSMDELQTALRG